MSDFRFTILRKLALECSYFQAKENLGWVIEFKVSMVFLTAFVEKPFLELNVLRFLSNRFRMFNYTNKGEINE